MKYRYLLMPMFYVRRVFMQLMKICFIVTVNIQKTALWHRDGTIKTPDVNVMNLGTTKKHSSWNGFLKSGTIFTPDIKSAGRPAAVP
jgi:hypothetical protein